MSVRLKLTLSYAGFLMLAGALLLAAVWVFLLRGVPGGAAGLVPTLSDLLRAFDPHNDGMLARLEAHLAEQRRFAANASHELRTPRAITLTALWQTATGRPVAIEP